MTTSKTIVMSLVSGADIITQIVGETETTYLLKHPFQLLVDLSSGEYQSVAFAKYMPYNMDGLVAVSKPSVVALTICSDRFDKIYTGKVVAFEELNANPSDLDNEAMMHDAADEADEYESDEYEDDYDPSEASPSTRPRTIH